MDYHNNMLFRKKEEKKTRREGGGGVEGGGGTAQIIFQDGTCTDFVQNLMEVSRNEPWQSCKNLNMQLNKQNFGSCANPVHSVRRG